MVVLFLLLSVLLFLYAALAPVFDYVISPDFHVIAWGLFFFALAHLVPHLDNGVGGGFGRTFTGRGRREVV